MNITVSAPGYATQTQTLAFTNNQPRTVNWLLVPSSTATTLTVASATGTYGGTTSAALSATLTSGGAGVSDKTISFTLNGISVGSATTNGSGLATLGAPSSLAGINAGSSPAGVTASFTADATYSASTASSSLTVSKANAAVSVTGFTGAYDGTAHGATGSATGVSGENLSALLSLGSTFTNVPGGTANWMFAGNDNYNAINGTANVVLSQGRRDVSGEWLTRASTTVQRTAPPARRRASAAQH